ncbi:hypothetical protein D3C73_1563000 [compost metagenome]
MPQIIMDIPGNPVAFFHLGAGFHHQGVFHQLLADFLKLIMLLAVFIIELAQFLTAYFHGGRAE